MALFEKFRPKEEVFFQRPIKPRETAYTNPQKRIKLRGSVHAGNCVVPKLQVHSLEAINGLVTMGVCRPEVSGVTIGTTVSLQTNQIGDKSPLCQNLLNGNCPVANLDKFPCTVRRIEDQQSRQ